MNFYRKSLAVKLFLRLGIKPRKASPELWAATNSVLRKHVDLAMAEYHLRKRLLNG